MFYIKANADGWVTIKGVHVYIGASGKIEKGPAKFIGSTRDDLTGGGKNTTKNSSSKNSSSRRKGSETMAQHDGGVKTPASRGRGSVSKNKANVKIPNPDSSVKKEVDNQMEGHRFRRETIARYAGIDFNKKEGTYIDKKTGKEIHPKDASKIIDGVAEKLNLIKKGDDNYRKVSGEPLHTPKTSKKSSTKKKELSPIEKYRKEHNIPKNVEVYIPQVNNKGEKYPSSVKTTAEKRAYTRARNNGMSKKQAETFAMNEFVPASPTQKATYNHLIKDLGMTKSEATKFMNKRYGNTKEASPMPLQGERWKR